MQFEVITDVEIQNETAFEIVETDAEVAFLEPAQDDEEQEDEEQDDEEQDVTSEEAPEEA